MFLELSSSTAGLCSTVDSLFLTTSSHIPYLCFSMQAHQSGTRVGEAGTFIILCFIVSSRDAVRSCVITGGGLEE